MIIDWNEAFSNDDDVFAGEFLRPRFYEHHEIKRMDSRAEYFLNQIFKAFKHHPKQLPQDTHLLFVKAVKAHLQEIIKLNEDKKVSSEIISFLEKGKLPCEDMCSYLPQSKYPNKDQIKNSKCPLLKNAKGACEGIRIIINHMAGMTDRYAHLEYSRLYFPPEVSRM